MTISEARHDAVGHLTAATFDEEVYGSSLPVIVDVWAPWCGPCKTLADVLEGIARDYPRQLRIFELNADEELEPVARFGIMSFPTLLVFQDGTLVRRLVGARGRHHLLEELSELISR